MEHKTLRQDRSGKQPPKEVNEEAAVEFKWGNKLEFDEQNPAIQLYGSFKYDGVEYSLFDCVYFGHENMFSIGKLVKIWETPDHKRMVEAVWFIRPEEIRVALGDDEPPPNELFLASGVGKGLSSVNPLEGIGGKCIVFCTSKDRRNPRVSEEELSMADFTFSRTYDVGSCRVLDDFPDTIAGRKVEYFFNTSDQYRSEKYSTKVPLGKISGPRKRDLDTMQSPYFDQKISKGDRTVQKVREPVNQQAPRLCEDNKVKAKRHFINVKRKPYTEKSNWFMEQPWEERVQRANQKGALTLLENLDPSFSSLEVEDLAWQCFGEKVVAKMIEPTYFSNPHYGQAMVIFKSEVAAVSAITDLEKKSLMLNDGRIIVGRRLALKKPEKTATSAGYLVIPKVKFKQQREEMRNAKSTSHCSQPNSLEFDMAVEWRLLQEQSDKWWNLLNKEQEKEIVKVRRQLMINSGNAA